MKTKVQFFSNIFYIRQNQMIIPSNRLVDLLDQGIEKSRALQKENDKTNLNEAELKKAEEAVAYGCIKYADLQSNRKNDYVFR